MRCKKKNGGGGEQERKIPPFLREPKDVEKSNNIPRLFNNKETARYNQSCCKTPNNHVIHLFSHPH